MHSVNSLIKVQEIYYLLLTYLKGEQVVVMEETTLNSICLPFKVLVKCETVGGIFIAPLVAGIFVTQEEFYTHNKTAQTALGIVKS